MKEKLWNLFICQSLSYIDGRRKRQLPIILSKQGHWLQDLMNFSPPERQNVRFYDKETIPAAAMSFVFPLLRFWERCYCKVHSHSSTSSLNCIESAQQGPGYPRQPAGGAGSSRGKTKHYRSKTVTHSSLGMRLRVILVFFSNFTCVFLSSLQCILLLL